MDKAMMDRIRDSVRRYLFDNTSHQPNCILVGDSILKEIRRGSLFLDATVIMNKYGDIRLLGMAVVPSRQLPANDFVVGYMQGMEDYI